MLSHRNVVSNILVNHEFDGKELVPGKDGTSPSFPPNSKESDGRSD